jgi:hypothetical protein
MKLVVSVAAAAAGAALLVMAACGEDEGLVRERLDGSSVEASVSGDGGTLACGLPLPTQYASTAFETNAKVEKDLAAHIEAIEAKMKATEGDAGVSVTAAELKAVYNEGAPSLRAVSTTEAQTALDGYFDAYGEAVGKTWTPDAAEKDGGAATGGQYGSYHVSKTGLDLREATAKTLLGGALYNHVLGIAAAPITDASVDRLLAAFGATPALANRSDDDAGADADRLIAEYASKRDDKAGAIATYRKVKKALLTMKAAATQPDKCKADLDAAVSVFLREWERASYATAIYYLNAASLAAADPAKGPEALHAFAEAYGFIAAFKGLPADKRKIQDSQIDALLAKVGQPWELIKNPGTQALKLKGVIDDITLVESFTPDEVDAFKTND